MSNIEEIIKRILTLKPNLTREEVEELIEAEKTKAAGLLTDEAAANLVASNLGITGAGERIESKITIGDITSGLNDVSLTGRVIHVFPSRTFDRKDGSQGKLGKIILGDKTGSVDVVFWDEKADLLKANKVKAGKIIRILHGYARERMGEIQVNVGKRGQVFMEPMDAVEENYPPVSDFFVTPGQVHNTGQVNLEGVVVDKYPVSTFTRSDESEGKVSRTVLEEGGGRINLVLWDEKATKYGELDEGTRIRIVSGSVREAQGGGYEVHLGWQTEVDIVEEGVKPEEPVPYWTKLGELKDGMRSVNIAARVYQSGETREFTRKDGSMGRVATVLIKDDTAVARLTLWDEEVDKLVELEPNTPIVVENGYTRAGYGGVDLNVGRYGELRINPDDVDIGEYDADDLVTRIINLEQGDSNVIIEGQIVDTPETREVNTRRGMTTVTNFRLDDNTGEVRVSLWRELGREVEDLMPGSEIRLENVNVTEPFDGLLQVSSGAFTKLKILKR